MTHDPERADEKLLARRQRAPRTALGLHVILMPNRSAQRSANRAKKKAYRAANEFSCPPHIGLS
jgi:hypothetical protein